MPKFKQTKNNKKNYANKKNTKIRNLLHSRHNPFFRFFLEKVFLKSSKMDKNNCPIFNFSKKNSNEKKPLFNIYSTTPEFLLMFSITLFIVVSRGALGIKLRCIVKHF